MTNQRVRYKGKYATTIKSLSKREIFKLIKNNVKHKVLFDTK